MAPTPSAGLGLKPEHFPEALAAPADGLWFEVHPENYMVDGGPRLAWLEAIRARHPLSLHGVALSLAAATPPDRAHVARLARLVRRFEPALVSEHLAWSTWRGRYHPDLLPFPRSAEALTRIVDNVCQVQDALRRTLALENPAHYLRVDGHAFDEIDFLREIARRSGCSLLLDVNNVHVGARNLGYSAEAYVDAFPGEHVAEIHVAGHTADPQHGDALLIDSHDAPVAREVWALCERVVARIGPRPVLLERDGNVPPFRELQAERALATGILRRPFEAAA
ncbi:MAG: DUF692 domain-containing protein [Betaproteobacteria bacterium]|nr:DUF692 domain-containing protein [Betaproteobacteria bacterium]MCC7218547.1 DUF692 domain-containing protein [Burkholderiales bacterium]